ncbi:hypothetical protein [Naumannella huperziae]
MAHTVESVIARRRLLGAGAGIGAASLLAGCGLDRRGGGERDGDRAYCVPRSATQRRAGIGEAELAYEENDRAQPFNIDADFARQLDGWLEFFDARAGLGAPDRIRTYGAWIDGSGSCDSWHHSGRALDFARLVRGDAEIVSCRNDLWREAADLPTQRRRYWALAASLHRHFSYVVTYLYNDAHRNHIHVDNGASGAELARFSTRSRTQLQGVQAVCSYLYGLDVPITGRWDDATRAATGRVLADIGVGGSLTDDGAWTALMGAATGAAAP